MRLQIEVSDLLAMRQCLARFDISHVSEADLLAIIAESSAVASELLADSLEDTAGRDYLIAATVAYAMRHIEDKPMEPLVGGAVYAEWHWPANASPDAYVREFEAAMSKSTRLLGWRYAAAEPQLQPDALVRVDDAKSLSLCYSPRVFAAASVVVATLRAEVWQLDLRPGWVQMGLSSFMAAPGELMFSVPLYDNGVIVRNICVGTVTLAELEKGGATHAVVADKHVLAVWRAAALMEQADVKTG